MGEGRKEDEHQMMPWKESVTLCGELQPRLVGFTISENKNHLNVHGISVLMFSEGNKISRFVLTKRNRQRPH